MPKKQLVCATISAFLAAASLSPLSLAQTDQKFVAAEQPPAPETVVATSETSVQPSTSSTKPPVHLSSALGLGPESRIHINGFLSAGAAATNASAEYLIPNHGTIDNSISAIPLTLIGLQFTADLAHSLDVVTQLVGDGNHINGNVAYRVNADWAFLRYAVNNYYKIQAGRFRLPAFLYSQTQQVGFSYPWVLLPNEVYRIVPFNNVNGITFISRTPIGRTGWNITVQPYYGSNKSIFTVYNRFNPYGLDVHFKENSIAGMVIGVGNDNVTIRGTYANVKLTGTIDEGVSAIPSITLFSSAPAHFYSVAAKLLLGDFIGIGEYANRKTPSHIASLWGFYASLGWKFGKLVPLLTYAQISTTNASQLAIEPRLSERPQDQNSFTLSLDYTLNSNLDIKGSISQINPLHHTFGLFNCNPQRSHVYLYGISLDAIF